MNFYFADTVCLSSRLAHGVQGCGDKGYGKPWFLHGSSTLCKPLWGKEGLVVAAC